MANLNKIMLIGRLTRDPESRSFASGAKVVQFGFAVNNRRKGQSGQWEDEPCFLDCKLFGGADSSVRADLLESSCRKGHQLFVEGHVVMEKWQDKATGDNRQKLVIVVDNFQFLERKGDGPAPSRQAASPAKREPEHGEGGTEIDGPEGIPF